jgi:hypothetical protein
MKASNLIRDAGMVQSRYALNIHVALKCLTRMGILLFSIAQCL